MLGKDACVNLVDSSETSQAAVSIANIKKQLQSKVSAIVGPESSGVTYNVIPTVKGAKTVLFSQAATDDGLTGISPYFFRNPAPNGFEASALGSQIVADGRSKVAFLTFNDPYGTNLRDGMEKVIADSGSAEVVYGGKGKNQEFPSTETNFGSDVSAALAAKPDAIVIIAFDQTKQIIPALVSAGWKMGNTYFVDGNLNDYSADLPDGTLDGAKGATQGVNPSPALRKRISAAYEANGGGAEADHLRLRRGGVRRLDADRARGGEGRQVRLGDDPEEPARRLRHHRRHRLQVLRGLQEAARRRARRSSTRATPAPVRSTPRTTSRAGTSPSTSSRATPRRSS